MKVKILILAIISTLFFCTDLAAQTRKRTSKSKKEKVVKEEVNLMEKLVADIRFGNIGFFNGASFAVKPGVGYKITNFLDAGIGSRVFFAYQNIGGREITLLDFGGFLYGRAKIKNFYFMGEYCSTNFEYAPDLHKSIRYPVVGGGYMYQGDDWKYGFEVGIPLNSEVRSINSTPIEYWINVNYNF